MKHTTRKKTFFILILIACVVLLLGSNTVFAEVNQLYTGADTVTDENLDTAFDNSTILKMIAKLVYAVGRFLEWILGTIFKLLTGNSDFPWADKIVFNAVPLLDVNFINPAEGSFVIGIQGALKNLYSTILALAVGFFGIVVLVTAIKLVISTIASEKAKYKQAIVDWLIGFVMIFCIHYAISFIFYLNEQLVEVASRIVVEQLKEKENLAYVQGGALVDKLIEKAEKAGVKYNGKLVADILRENQSMVNVWINALSSTDRSKGLHEALMKKVAWHDLWDKAKSTDEQLENLGMIITWAAESKVTVKELQEIKDNLKMFVAYDEWRSEYIACCAMGNWFNCKDSYCLVDSYEYSQAMTKTEFLGLFSDEEQAKYFAEELGIYYDDLYHGLKTLSDSQNKKGYAYIYECDFEEKEATFYILSQGSKELAELNGEKKFAGEDYMATSFYWTSVLDDMITLKGASPASGGATGGTVPRLISDLATYFRYYSYDKSLRTTNQTGVKNGENPQIQNMIMYAILVAQSLILFIAYIKRLFYVVLLAMMAPVVVVFDFFQKFGK